MSTDRELLMEMLQLFRQWFPEADEQALKAAMSEELFVAWQQTARRKPQPHPEIKIRVKGDRSRENRHSG